MSTVSVVKKDGLIAIASESLTTFGSTKLYGDFSSNSKKIVTWGDNYIGMVGSVAMHMIFEDIIAKSKKTPKFQSTAEVYSYFNKLHEKLKKKYHINPEEDKDDPVESSQYEIVICNSHGIFGVHSLREVYDLQKFWSYGSGSEFALGAMHALYNDSAKSAEQIARAGIEAGIQFDTSSGGDIVCFTIETSK